MVLSTCINKTLNISILKKKKEKKEKNIRICTN